MLQAVATPGSLPKHMPFLPAATGARIIAGGTAVMPVLNYGHRRFQHARQPAQQPACPASASRTATATIGAATTLSELEDAPARLPAAGARHDRFADHPQHGDSRRQSFRQAALWRFRRLPDRARRDGDGFQAGAATRIEPVERTRRHPALRPRRDRHQIAFALPAAGSFKFRKAGPQGAQRRGDRHGRGSGDGRAAARSRNAASALGGVAKIAVRAPSVEKALIGKPLDRASVEAAAKRGSARHRARSTMPMPAPGTAPA